MKNFFKRDYKDREDIKKIERFEVLFFLNSMDYFYSRHQSWLVASENKGLASFCRIFNSYSASHNIIVVDRTIV